MRVIGFYITLCFFLLSGGKSLYANTYHNGAINSFIQNFPEKQQVKIFDAGKKNLVIESTDLNLDEEFNHDDNYHDRTGNKFLSKKYCFTDRLHLKVSPQITSKEYAQRIKIFAPFCGYSNPIYIRQRVLRI
jgi:hypothetical protein